MRDHIDVVGDAAVDVEEHDDSYDGIEADAYNSEGTDATRD